MTKKLSIKYLALLLSVFLFQRNVSAQTTSLIMKVNGVPTTSVNYCAGTTLLILADPFCNGTNDVNNFTYTLSGGPGVVSGFNNQFSINPTTNTVYTVTAIPLPGSTCTAATATIAVNYSATSPTVIQTPLAPCTNNNASLQLTNLPGPNNSYTVGWQTNIPGFFLTNYSNPSQQYPSSSFNTYTVSFTSSSPIGCTGTKTGNFAINSIPCNNGTIITSTNLPSINSTTASIQNNIDVVGVVSIDNSNVFMSPNTTIFVKAGSELIIKNSWLHGCSCPWQGIYVEQGGKLTILSASVIEDANIGIQIKCNTILSDVSVENTLFNKCKVGISMQTSPTLNMNGKLRITSSIFTCRNIATSTIYGNMTNFTALHNNFILATQDQNLSSNDVLSLSNTIDAVATKTTLVSGKRSNIGLHLKDHRLGVISPIQSAGGPTIFDNMDFGIYAEASSIKVTSSHFMDMPGNNIDLDGIGVYSNDSKGIGANKLTVQGCKFNNVCRGIHAETIGEVNILNNIISSNITTFAYDVTAKRPGQYGVYYSYFATNPIAQFAPVTWVIKSNCIRDYKYGVAIVRNNYQGLSTNDFSCNTIFGAPPLSGNPNGAYCLYGLYVNDGVGNSGSGLGGPPSGDINKYGEVKAGGNDIIKVRVNAIKLVNVKQQFAINKNQNAVIALSAFGPYIQGQFGFSNSMGLALRDNSAQSSVIDLTDCENITVRENTITGFSTANSWQQPNTTGINCIRSKVRVLNNVITKNKKGIWFNGNCNPSAIAFNAFAYASNGMYYNNDAETGTQGSPTGPTGNTFIVNGSAKVDWQTNFANTTIPAVASFIYYHNSPGSPEHMPNSKQTFAAPANQVDAFINGVSLKAVNPSAGSIVPLLEPCNAAPPLLQLAREGVLQNLQDSINYVKQLILNYLPNQAYANEKWWNNKLKALRMVEFTPALRTNDAVIDDFYTNTELQDIGKLNKVYAFAENGQTQLAEGINSTVQGNDINENYRKAINYVHLKYINDSLYVPDSTTINSLENIANTCPEVYGDVVNEARNLLMGMHKTVIEFTDNCDLNNARQLNINYETKSEQIFSTYYNYSLYPNPNIGIFTLRNNAKETYSKVLVVDILGKTISETTFNGSNSLEINISNADKGIYFIKVLNEANKLVYFGKAIVQ